METFRKWVKDQQKKQNYSQKVFNVKKYLIKNLQQKKYLLLFKKIKRISFLGYSLGGLIIRACIPYLQKYYNKFYTFMTFSTPHVGNMYQTNKIVDAGLWIMKKFSKQTCLNQLTLSDAKDIKNTYIYSLSTQPVFYFFIINYLHIFFIYLFQGLNYFENVVVFSSLQDSYVSYSSARIQKCSQSQNQDAYFLFKKNKLQFNLGIVKYIMKWQLIFYKIQKIKNFIVLMQISKLKISNN
ncbi:serine esterase, putative [Ichthyophthirius multifiliis]|uniref:Serine esterase, putative n=1 Tax=Ichthyophthirius multifiliis TaxID=5932 RepID=G0QJP3_ICHMU|nr:serine esterase, putative [Ichthyophthirius multifiliis]EGR34565.1 serine esterase, putative [Ichthyophthirius multifiliis]|eukprot:XP_004039869.1 serine esterase, putative [Ichthyophthirius multifiliis]